MRTHYCGAIREENIGETVLLCGWVLRFRDHGGVIFFDLRDRSGVSQLVCDPEFSDVFKTAECIRNEYCLSIKGIVQRPRHFH